MNEVIDISGNAVAAPQGVQAENIGARKVNLSAGEMRGDVSSQWFARSPDEKYLSLGAMHAHKKERADNSESMIIPSDGIQFDAPDPESVADLHELTVTAKGFNYGAPIEPNNWSFGQACQLVKAPGAFMRDLPSQLTADVLNYRFHNFRGEQIKTYIHDDGRAELLALNGPDYGRVTDAEVIEAVMSVAGEGTGDRDWKVPGVMDWSTHIYDPNTPISLDTTTLFASDRDVFIFLVDDRRPIEIGKLPDGSPDYMFRGFYVWNSEVGSKSLGIATMYLRAICCNRLLWGVEQFTKTVMRHSKNAPYRFVQEARPALEQFTQGSVQSILDGVDAAKAAKVASDDDEALVFLQNRKFSRKQSADILARVESDEQHKARTVWDMAQGITSLARDIPQQDKRVELERQAGALLDKVAA